MKKENTESIKKEDKYLGESLPGLSSSPSSSGRGHEKSTIGILRLDFNKPRGSSGSSVEFRTPRHGYQECGPPSPQPSVLSVTFAAEEPSVISMDKVRFVADDMPSEGEDDEDYSQSVSAIFQRKASTRRSRSSKRRRSSSPMFTPDGEDGQNTIQHRRRSSVFTTSSGDTGITVEDAVQEQILQNIKLHKEVLSSVKQQPWNMRRKLRLVRQAQAYIRRHEGELQERLAQSRSTKDILARFNIVIIKQWQYTKRELANLMNVLIPWEIRIKEIESHFGSVVASYFTFLRWLFWVNLVTSVVLIAFVAVPEMLVANTAKAGMRKKLMDDEVTNATKLFTLWDFDGVLKYSPLFYGYYSHQDPEEKSLAKKIGYTMPLAYFLTELIVYIYSFVAILRRMAENSRQSKLSEKDEECVFTWKVFTGWDYMIGNAETAHNRTASIILGFKEALLEEAEKKRDEGRNWKVTSLRVFAHINVLWLLGSSVYAVILVVDRSTQPEAEHGWWRKNEITIVVSLITFVFPAFFEGLGIIEQYHPRKKLRMQLARIMALNLLNIYTLIFASFSKINEMSNTLEALRPTNASYSVNVYYQGQSGTNHSGLSPSCRNITVPCPSISSAAATTVILSLLSSNNNTMPGSSNLMDFSTTTSFNIPPSINESSTYSSLMDLNLETSSSYETYPYYNYSVETFITDLTLSTKNEFVEISDNLENLDSDEYLNVDNDMLKNGNVNTTIFVASEMYEINQKEINSTNLTLTENVTVLEIGLLVNETTPLENNSYSHNLTTSSEQNFKEVYNGSDLPQSSTTQIPSSTEICFKTICDNITEPKATFNHLNPSPPSQSIACSDSKVLQYSDLTPYIDTIDIETRKKLRPLCWETMFGREMVKLTVMDLVMTVVSTIMVDFFRAVFVRYMNNCWCWDLEKKFPQYGDFKIAENILHLVNNQGMVWMGMFFSPGLPLINIIKLAIMMYLRSWAVLTCNVPHEVVFRASRSNNFYFALLLTMLFLCVLPVGYAVVWVVPSWHCGPFSNYYRIYHIFTTSVRKALPYKSLHKGLDYIASPSIIIPLLMLLVLIIYYLISLTSALREANNDLKIQLRRERTEERRKMFQLVDKKRQEAENPILKWKKVMPNFPQGKLSIADIPIDLLKLGALKSSALNNDKQKELIEEFMKKAKQMPSRTSEEENGLLDAGDGTDIEQHDSLPYDMSKIRKSTDSDIETPTNKIIVLKNKHNGDVIKKKHIEKHQGYHEREDSIISGWSDVPEIRIIQTESAENVDGVNSDDDKSCQKKTARKIKLKEIKDKVEKHIEERTQKLKMEESETKNCRKELKGKKSKDLKCSPKTQRKFKETDNQSIISNEEQAESNKKYKLNNKEKIINKDNKSNCERKGLKSKKQKTKDLKKSDKELKDNSVMLPGECDSPLPTNSFDLSTSIENQEYASSSESSEDEDVTEENSHDEDSYCYSDSGDKIERDGDIFERQISNERDQTNKTIQSKEQKKKTNMKLNTESEDSDLSSQNTVKQNIEQSNISKENNSSVVHCGKEKSEPSFKTQSSKDQTDTKKFMARFKIASVLLKEARRRSSSGLEDQ